MIHIKYNYLTPINYYYTYLFHNKETTNITSFFLIDLRKRIFFCIQSKAHSNTLKANSSKISILNSAETLKLQILVCNWPLVNESRVHILIDSQWRIVLQDTAKRVDVIKTNIKMQMTTFYTTGSQLHYIYLIIK